MYTISKEFEFSASHILSGLPEDHPCGRCHGHNYKVKVVLASDSLTSVGFILDYRELAPFKSFIDNTLDHRHLNDVIPTIQPSAENLAEWLYNTIKRNWPSWPLQQVQVSETPKTWASYGQ